MSAAVPPIPAGSGPAVSPVGLSLGNRHTRSPGWWAMVWTIATEATLFVYALFAYFYLGSQFRGPWPPDGPPDLRLALPNTVILVASSFVLYWGERGIKQGKQMRLRLAMALTTLMGLVFLAIQIKEWGNKTFTPQSNSYASMFYTITGFHGAHVCVGLLMLIVVQIWAWKGTFSADKHLAVTNVGLYWHFVDVVWLAVFTSLYLTPRWT